MFDKIIIMDIREDGNNIFDKYVYRDKYVIIYSKDGEAIFATDYLFSIEQPKEDSFALFNIMHYVGRLYCKHANIVYANKRIADEIMNNDKIKADLYNSLK